MCFLNSFIVGTLFLYNRFSVMLSFPHLQGKFSNTCHGPAPSSSLHCSREAGGRVRGGGGGWGGSEEGRVGGE